jgi:hypothetical protein
MDLPLLNLPLTAHCRRVAVAAAQRVVRGESIDAKSALAAIQNEQRGKPAGDWPAIEVVETLIASERRLFPANRTAERLAELRWTSYRLMEWLKPFKTRIVGPVVSGEVDSESKIYLHLFIDYPEQLLHWLIDHQVDYEEDERRLRYPGQREERMPMIRLWPEGEVAELTLFPPDGVRQAPLSPIDLRPQRRITSAALKQLIEKSEQDS